MSQKQKRKSDTKEWERVASLFEGPEGIEIMKSSRALTAIEKRKLLGSGATKLVSVRIPEDDLDALKAIADSHKTVPW